MVAPIFVGHKFKPFRNLVLLIASPMAYICFVYKTCSFSKFILLGL
jgi:hypothetical protein